MEELNLELNHTYLLKYGNTDILSSITVLLITDKAYKICWNGSGTEHWELKERMNSDYTVVEDISMIIVKKQQKNFDNTITTTEYVATEYETCPICHGTGIVMNGQTTAAFITCPLCQGNKRVVKRTEVKA